MPKGERASLHAVSTEVTLGGNTEYELQRRRRRQAAADMVKSWGN